MYGNSYTHFQDDILRSLNEEKDKLENLWKSSTTELHLQRAAKSLWEKTNKQIDLLYGKRAELAETLKSINFSMEESTISEELNETSTTPPKSEGSRSHLSRAICQFFVFGTLFGVVVTITACSCFLQPKNQNRAFNASSKF